MSGSWVDRNRKRRIKSEASSRNDVHSMKDAETTEDVLFAAAEGWLDVTEGEVSTTMVAQYQGA